jgi:integrase
MSSRVHVKSWLLPLRTVEYLIPKEVERLIKAARARGRYGAWDATAILVTYRHGLRASELAELRWDQVDFDHHLLHARRKKNGIPSVHPLSGDELRALRALRREHDVARYVFITERGSPMSAAGFRKMLARTSFGSWCIRTCLGMPAGSSSPTMAMTHGRCSTTSGTRIFSTPRAIPGYRRRDSNRFGTIEVARVG